MEAIVEKLKRSWMQALLIIIGLSAIGVGVWQSGEHDSNNEVVVVGNLVDEGETNQELSQVVVDVSGAVNNPGVYYLASGSRIAQALEKAGGFSNDADGDYVAKMINQAEMVKDGQKIYIPLLTATTAVGIKSPEGEVAGVSTINVNVASQSELESLWGIGEARAQAIVANRPYSSLDDLKTKAGIPDNVMQKNEGKMSVF